MPAPRGEEAAMGKADEGAEERAFGCRRLSQRRVVNRPACRAQCHQR
jgi:hypothetical protein